MSLLSKIKRRLAPYQARRMLPIKLEHSIVSFSFDDCPKSVIDNAVKPLERENWQATVYAAMGLCDTTNHLGLHMSREDVKAVWESGFEIGDHTFSHCNGAALPLDAVLEDIEKNQAELNALNIPRSESFAYPYGDLTPTLKTALETKFKGARGITSRSHEKAVDLNQIGSNRLYNGRDFDILLSQISALKDRPAWMTIFTHDVREKPSEYGCTPAQMRSIIKAVKECGAQVLPMAKTIDYLEAENA